MADDDYTTPTTWDRIKGALSNIPKIQDPFEMLGGELSRVSTGIKDVAGMTPSEQLSHVYEGAKNVAMNPPDPWRSWEEGRPLEAMLSGPQTGVFAGRAAKMADLSKLNAAENMATEGANRNAIWDATGWFQGADGKWRFEIPDNASEFKHLQMPKAPDRWSLAKQYFEQQGVPATKIATGQFPLLDKEAFQWADHQIGRGIKHEVPMSTLLEHQPLYENYPSAASIPVSAERSLALKGSFVPSDNAVTISDASTITERPSDVSARQHSTALHELQHYIQSQEGFAPGSNPNGLLRPGIPAWDIYQRLLANMQRPLSHEVFSQAGNYEGLAPKRDYDVYKKMVKKDADKWKIEAQKTALQEAYRRAAGEVEARNVQSRMAMTPEERAATPPWATHDVPDEEQIVHYRAEGGFVDPIAAALRIAKQGGGEAEESSYVPKEANPFLDMLTRGAAEAYRSASQWPKRMEEAATQFPRDVVEAGDVAMGKRPYDEDEAIQLALRLAGTVSGGAVPFERPAGSFAAGAARAAPNTVPPELLKAGAAAEKAANRLEGRTIYGPESDLGFAGKSPHEFQPEDWGAFGRHYGVGNLGPASNAEFEASLVPHELTSGRTVTIPGGLETDKPFTYYDLLHLKAQGIDPSAELHPDVHRQIHNRMMTTMSPEGPVGPERMLNQYMMGMISPNNPLTPNQFSVAAMMAKEGDNSISRLAGLTPWSLENLPPSTAQRSVRDKVSRLISSKFGLQEGARGGLGSSGTADYTRISDLAKMMEKDPEFFRFKGEAEGGKDKAENWLNFVSRVASQVPGLSAKTGSFSTVWQNVRDAAISAVDRHMATEWNDSLFANPKEKKAFEKKVLDQFNADRPKKDRIKDYQTMLETPGGRGAYVDQVMNHVNAHGKAKYRTAKGEINPNVPEHMRGIDWVNEPKEVTKVSPAYLRALEENDRNARLNNQGLFANQWMLWDRMRRRIEPHEVMFPGLEKLPRMSHNQLMDAYKAHMDAGYGTAPFVPKPVANPSSLAHFSLGASPVTLLPNTSSVDDESTVPAM